MTSRACPTCPRSRMRSGLRHLHELGVGARFRFPGRAGEVHTLLRTTPSRAVITSGSNPEDVRFETADGQTVAFTRPTRESSCSLGAEVEPL